MEIVDNPQPEIDIEREDDRRVIGQPKKYLYKPINNSSADKEDEGTVVPLEGERVVSFKQQRVYTPITNTELRNHLQTLYQSILISFIKARHLIDNFRHTGFKGYLRDGELCDAREIYYDAEACLDRIARGMKYMDSVNGSDKNRTYQNVLKFRAILANTDTFILTAFIFTWILTNEKKYHGDVETALKNIQEDRLSPNLDYNTTGIRIKNERMSNYETKLNAKTIVGYLTFYTKERFSDAMVTYLRQSFSEMTEAHAEMMFIAYQSELDKALSGTVVHKEKNRREIDRSNGRIAQNAADLYYTLDCIINNDDRLAAVLDALSLRLDYVEKPKSPDPFVMVNMMENKGLRFYDRELRQLLEYASSAVVQHKTWSLIEVYCELASVPSLLFNQMLQKYVFSRNSNESITLWDLTQLLYEATMPLYHASNSDLLSNQFRMSYDFLFLLREQHRRFRNALQFMLLVKKAAKPFIVERIKRATRAEQERLGPSEKIKGKPISITKNDEEFVVSVMLKLKKKPIFTSCPIDVPLDSSMVDAFVRERQVAINSTDWRRRLDNRLNDENIKTYETVPLARMRQLLLQQPYLCDYVREVVYPRFGEHLWRRLIRELKVICGLYGASPVMLSLGDITLLNETLSSIVIQGLPSLEKRLFDAHFKITLVLSTSNKVVNDDIRMWINYASTVASNPEIIVSLIDETIESLVSLPIGEEADKTRELISELLLLQLRINTLDHEDEWEKSWSLVRTRIMRRDVNLPDVNMSPILCTDSVIIGLIERHPSFFTPTKTGLDYTIHVFGKRVRPVSFGTTLGSLLAREPQNLIRPLMGYTEWFTFIRQTVLSVIASMTRELQFDAVPVSARFTNDKANVGDLKQFLVNERRYRYVLLYRSSKIDGSQLSLPIMYKYKIINDTTKYDMMSLSRAKDKLFLLVLEDSPDDETLALSLPPFDTKNVIIDEGEKALIVVVETRGIHRVSYTTEISSEASFGDYSKETLYAKYNKNGVHQCIGYIKFQRQQGVILVMIVREELGNKEGGCLYDITTFSECDAFLRRYASKQRAAILYEIRQKKQTITTTTTTKKKKNGPTQKGSSQWVLTKKQVADICVSYNTKIDELIKKDGNPLEKISYYLRNETMITCKSEYFTVTNNWTKDQLQLVVLLDPGRAISYLTSIFIPVYVSTYESQLYDMVKDAQFIEFNASVKNGMIIGQLPIESLSYEGLNAEFDRLVRLKYITDGEFIGLRERMREARLGELRDIYDRVVTANQWPK